MIFEKRKFILKYLFSLFILSAIAFSFATARDFYWENSQKITSADSRFPSTVYNDKNSILFWQEIEAEKKQIYLSCQIYEGSNKWKTVSRFAGPFSYSGEIPDIYSAASQNSEKVAVACLTDVNTISVYISEDGGNSFVNVTLPSQEQPLVAPRIYSMSDNSLILFTSLGKNESFSMLYSKSTDGINWTPFKQFEPSSGYSNPFIPCKNS